MVFYWGTRSDDYFTDSWLFGVLERCLRYFSGFRDIRRRIIERGDFEFDILLPCGWLLKCEVKTGSLGDSDESVQNALSWDRFS